MLVLGSSPLSTRLPVVKSSLRSVLRCACNSHHRLAPSRACGAVVVVNSLSALSCSSSRCVHVIVVTRVKVVVVLVIAMRAWRGGGQCERKVVEKWWSNHELRCGACRASCGRCRVSVCTKVIDRGIRVTISTCEEHSYQLVHTTYYQMCLGSLLGSFPAVPMG